MIWPMLIMAAGSMMSDNSQRNADYKTQIAQNKAIREANTKNMIRTGYEVGMLNVQKGQKLMELQQRRAMVREAELADLSSAQNNAAASGTVGASVDAVLSDVKMQYDKARADISAENEIDALNFNTALHSTIQGGIDALKQSVRPTGMSDMAMLGRAVVAGASQYAGDKMSLGLGQQGQLSQRQRLPAGQTTRGIKTR